MIDILNTAPAISAKRAKLFLKDSIVWIDTFRSGQMQKQILDWIRQDQLTVEGVDADGEFIGFYSFSTALSDSRKGFNEPYDLNDTGAFYASMFIEVLKDELIINANSAKMEDQEWWTERILELTEESLEKLRDVYKERIIIYAERILLERL